MPQRLRFSLLEDRPEEDPAALWPGVHDLSEQLVLLVREWSRDARVPLLVCGDWGSGKTTLLHAMRRSLLRHDDPSPVVWFDAWRHEGADALLPALIRTVWESIPDAQRQRDETRATMIQAARIALQMGARATGVLARVSGFGGLADLTGAIIEGGAAAPDALSVIPEEAPSTSLVRALHDLIARGWPTAEGIPPVSPIIFIDDLDRCSPHGALALLDQIRALLAATLPAGAHDPTSPLRLRFVMAMDREVLLKAVSAKYRDIERYDANRFLEKMFPLAFHVPQPTTDHIQGLLRGFIQRTHRSSAEPLDAMASRHLDALVRAHSAAVFANPRLMKRCVNKFGLVVGFEASLSTAPPHDARADQTLAHWVVATERWPHLRRILVDYDEQRWAELGQALQTGQASSHPEVQRLSEHRGLRAWLREHVFADGRPELRPFLRADQRLQRWGL